MADRWMRVTIDRTVFHVWPPDDSQEHRLTKDCPCGPLVEKEKVKGKVIKKAIVHKAFDGRPGPLEKTDG